MKSKSPLICFLKRIGNLESSMRARHDVNRGGILLLIG